MGTVMRRTEEVAQHSPAIVRKRDPYHLDMVVRYSGAAYTRAGKTKQVAAAHGLSVSRGSRFRSGDVSAPLTHALLALANADKTTSIPVLVEAVAIVNQAEISGEPTHVLVAERAKLEAARFDLRRDEDFALYAGEPTTEIRSKIVDLYMELYLIDRELDERKRRGK